MLKDYQLQLMQLPRQAEEMMQPPDTLALQNWSP